MTATAPIERTPKRTCVHLAESWYAETTLNLEIVDYVDELMLCSGDAIRGTDGTLSIRWTNLGGNDGESTPYVHVFGDSWKMFSTFSDVLEKLGELKRNADRSPKALLEIITAYGIEDVTLRDHRSQTPAPRG